ncbi:hypothetical protein G6O67_004190 [Ophiocordyceps sinensis]|uniref:Uncharacterized protein n=1 Tax=Ophiocordyceps sinensis TaxID=72228 RepID=A0A8H4LY50_9HYPO|nr:hypothetical protein G6O67_004190 [Ophiocordyceps sinensis]
MAKANKRDTSGASSSPATGCGFTSTSELRFRCHLQAHEDRHRCPYDGCESQQNAFRYPGELRDHVITAHHSTMYVKNLFCCPHCQYFDADPDNLEKHLLECTQIYRQHKSCPCSMGYFRHDGDCSGVKYKQPFVPLELAFGTKKRPYVPEKTDPGSKLVDLAEAALGVHILETMLARRTTK